MVFEPRVRALLKLTPDMQATVLAERVAWVGSITWFRENVKRIRVEHLRVDPADRLVWSPCDAAECDLWVPTAADPAGGRRPLPVLAMSLAFCRFTFALIIPTRKTEDLLLGSWEVLQ